MRQADQGIDRARLPVFQRGDIVRIDGGTPRSTRYIVMAIDTTYPPTAQLVEKDTGFPRREPVDKLRHA